MSQHDFNIANQTAAPARADINNALTALASLSSGATAPSTTVANMLWYDTSTDTLKLRNEADSGWIVLGVTDQAASSFFPSNAVPAGAVNSFAMNSAPSGWLSCNGNAVSRTTYAALFSAIGTTYGTGDGSTTFNLPDLRGEFVRGLDNGRGVDSGRALGSAQSHAIENITGSITNARNDLSDGVTASGAFSVSLGAAQFDANAGTNESLNISFDASRVVNTATETRPRNIALLYCIKT